mmetsp:Transcript_9209/g.27108  ORF Transcript_9209/g.27108 Transcript_9209/m.27108 type:complete len:111 (+) Transcript_9209:334-666(+)
MSALLPGRLEVHADLEQAVGSAALRAKVLSGAVDAADVSRLVAAVHGPLTQLVAPVQDGEVEEVRRAALAAGTPARMMALLLCRTDTILSETERLVQGQTQRGEGDKSST